MGLEIPTPPPSIATDESLLVLDNSRGEAPAPAPRVRMVTIPTAFQSHWLPSRQVSADGRALPRPGSGKAARGRVLEFVGPAPGAGAGPSFDSFSPETAKIDQLLFGESSLEGRPASPNSFVGFNADRNATPPVAVREVKQEPPEDRADAGSSSDSVHRGQSEKRSEVAAAQEEEDVFGEGKEFAFFRRFCQRIGLFEEPGGRGLIPGGVRR